MKPSERIDQIAKELYNSRWDRGDSFADCLKAREEAVIRYLDEVLTKPPPHDGITHAKLADPKAVPWPNESILEVLKSIDDSLKHIAKSLWYRNIP